jgi:hypothetical protein
MVLPWKHPFTCIVAGPTSCGKSFFVSRFIQNLKYMVDHEIKEIVWCFSEQQPLHETLKNNVSIPMRFIQGIPDISEVVPNPIPRLLIIDDFMREAKNNVVDIFSKGSHHHNLSVMFITQNLFHQGKGTRDLSLNAHYIVYFKNPRDRSQISHFARQVYPEEPKFIHEAYTDATCQPYSYILFDMKQDTPEAFRFRSSIFPDEKNVAYIPKHGGHEYSKHMLPV